MKTLEQYPDQYLHVEECRSGQTWIVPIADNEPLDIEALIAKWVNQEYVSELRTNIDKLIRQHTFANRAPCSPAQTWRVNMPHDVASKATKL